MDEWTDGVKEKNELAVNDVLHVHQCQIMEYEGISLRLDEWQNVKEGEMSEGRNRDKRKESNGWRKCRVQQHWELKTQEIIVDSS